MQIPREVEQVLERFLCCEFATVGRDGTPVAWPVVALHRPPGLVLSTSIGFPVKAANVRRDPRVSLLFSDATGSGLVDPPSVLVQGTAAVDDGLQTWGEDLGAHWRRVSSLQPIGRHFSGSPPARWFMDWYYMRLVLRVTPVTVRWWPRGDTAAAPREVGVGAG